jgi:type VII secretion protein EccB
MATRKDLLKAQSFVQQRMVSALVLRDPDNPATPLRRLRTASFIGILIGVIVMAGFGVAGLLLNGGFSPWTKSESDLIVIDTESGAVFTYRGEAGNRQLRPAANITSALLLVDGGWDSVKRVKTESMKGVDLLPMQGIPAAPRQLPKASSLSGVPLRLCSALPENASPDTKRAITLEIGQGEAPDRNQAVLLVAADGVTEYFVYDGVKHTIKRDERFLRAPAFMEFRQIGADDRFLNTLPTGTPIEPLTVPGNGGVVTNLSGRLIGDIVSIGDKDDPNSQFFIVLADGYSSIAWIDFKMMPETAYKGTVTSEDVAQSTSRTTRLSASDIPDGMPAPDQRANRSDASLCATWTDTTKPPVISVGVDTPDAKGTESGSLTEADRIVQVEGGGAMFQNDTSLDTDAPAFLIVNRKRYSIPDMVSRIALGYQDAAITRVPPEIISLIPDGLPAGQALDRKTADRVIEG